MNGWELQVINSLLKMKGWDGKIYFYLFIHLFLFIYLFVYLCIYLFTYLFIYLFSTSLSKLEGRDDQVYLLPAYWSCRVAMTRLSY